VQAVQPGSATMLRLGDVILAVNGIRVSSAADVGAAMGTPELGKKLTLRVVRGSHRITLTEIPSPTTYLGAKVRDGGEREKGAVVVAVASQGPADLAKLKPGDLITAVEGTRIENVGELLEAIGVHQPGEQVSLTVSRGSRELHLSATLARRPS
jgi:S1-C subfamily serine protease